MISKEITLTFKNWLVFRIRFNMCFSMFSISNLKDFVLYVLRPNVIKKYGRKIFS